MNQELLNLSAQYLKAADALHNAIRDIIRDAGGFINATNNMQDKEDIRALVFDKAKGYTETKPIRALRVDEKGEVEVCIGNYGTIYTDKFLRGKASEDHWTKLRGSNVMFYQTILSIIKTIDVYL
jgi:hypothetical protein